ncbi:hypothetical protein C2869_16405 [Saccharobesus litoralis]|uniref:Uncharacterized protein n=1 Tax=Saccharobesus litoralis TaxID=2172099 RepID=A0A2S0VUK6_9ALTE|nr:hypothetical protein [Saccharobesus litoralis]AWB67907.1 hypothetical protein C2869_16405 [Saccharobesus litoralis]
MPVIQIKSLPIAEEMDISDTCLKISEAFALKSKLKIEHVSVTWQYLPLGAYADSGLKAHYQPDDSHPIIVSFLTPDFHQTTEISKMLIYLAQIISQHTAIRLENIFIQHAAVKSGHVFDKGRVVNW